MTMNKEQKDQEQYVHNMIFLLCSFKQVYLLQRSDAGESEHEIVSTQSSSRSRRSQRTQDDEPLAQEITLNGSQITNGFNGNTLESESMDVDDGPVEISEERFENFVPTFIISTSYLVEHLCYVYFTSG